MRNERKGAHRETRSYCKNVGNCVFAARSGDFATGFQSERTRFSRRRLQESARLRQTARLVALDEWQHHERRNQAGSRVDETYRNRRVPELPFNQRLEILDDDSFLEG